MALRSTHNRHEHYAELAEELLADPGAKKHEIRAEIMRAKRLSRTPAEKRRVKELKGALKAK